MWWRCHSILLLSLVTRCIETIYVCMWHMFVFMSVIVIVWGFCGNVCCVAGIVKDSGFLNHRVVKHITCL